MSNYRSFCIVTILSVGLAVMGCTERAAEKKPDGEKKAEAPAKTEPVQAVAPAAVESKVELTQKNIKVLSLNAVPEATQKDVRAVVDTYLQMKEAYVAKDVAAIKKTAQAVAAAASKVNSEGLDASAKTALATHQQVIAQSVGLITADKADLKEMRLQLMPLSEATYAAARSFGAKKIFVQYCPMANGGTGGHWLAAESEIRNPYFGDEMLACGEVRESM